MSEMFRCKGAAGLLSTSPEAQLFQRRKCRRSFEYDVSELRPRDLELVLNAPCLKVFF